MSEDLLLLIEQPESKKDENMLPNLKLNRFLDNN
jgi:hypothetical protein